MADARPEQTDKWFEFGTRPYAAQDCHSYVKEICRKED
jgi:hypothetical protein